MDAAPTSTVMGLNPFDPHFYEDPYSQYAAIRESEPVHATALGPWLVTRWDDVHQVLRRPGTSVEDRNVGDHVAIQRRELAQQADREYTRSLAILNIDPPDHTRLRKLVSKAFTPRAVEKIRAHVAALTDEILDDLAQRGEPIDLVGELAFPLPFAVISEMLGMPEGDRDQLREWSHTITQFLDPLLSMNNGPAIFEALDHMHAAVAEAIAWKRTRPTDDDLLHALISAEDDGQVLSDEELVQNVTLLYLAGHETTVNLIGNGVHALLENRDQMELLVDDPSLDANAVEELLRYDSPVQFSRRIAMEPFELHGQAIQVGDLLMTCLGAANRDPRKFGDDADHLDLSRANAREHVSFGSGVHHCLGAALARLEGQEVIGRLVRRFPGMEPVGDPTHNGRMVLRGYDRLPVSLG